MKKSFFAVCCLAGLFAFSCATTPEEQKKPDIDLENPSETETDKDSEDIINESEGDELTVEDFEEEPLPEEKIEEEILPEIEETSDEEKSEITEEILPIEEEIVLDAPVEEITEENDDNKISMELNDKEENEASSSSENENDNSSQASELTENENKEDSVQNKQAEVESEVSENKNDENTESSNVLSEENLLDDEPVEEQTEPEEKITPSRTMKVDKNQLIDITYPGKGWIYQGCIDEEGNVDVRNRYFVFGGRKLGGEDTAFTLRSRLPGTYLLHFYKNDALSGSFIDDYLEVSVTNKVSENQNHIQAPSYAEIIPPKAVITSEYLKQKKQIEEDKKRYASEEKSESGENKISSVSKNDSENKNSSKNDNSQLKTVIQKNDSDSSLLKETENNIKSDSKTAEKETKSASVEINKSPALILKEAQSAYESKNYAESLRLVDIYLEIAVNKIDEGLFHKAQTLEAKSRVQNIKEAVKLYDLLIQTYPQSKLWDKANERSIYLKRMYINIR